MRLRRCDPEHVTYVIDRNINYSNICYVDRTFCAFYRHKNDEEAYVLSTEELHRKIEELRRSVVTILLQGGHNPKLPFSWYQETLADLKAHFPDIHIHGFSPSEIEHFGKLFKMPTKQVIAELQEAGLDSIPGGGAEILNDRVPADLAPTKVSASRGGEIMEGSRPSLGMSYRGYLDVGDVGTLPERVDYVSRIRESQGRTCGYTAFICSNFQPGFTPMTEEQLKHRAAARERLQGQP